MCPACRSPFYQFFSKTTADIDFPFVKLTTALLVVTSSTKNNESVGNKIYLHFTANVCQHLLTDAPQLKKINRSSLRNFYKRNFNYHAPVSQ